MLEPGTILGGYEILGTIAAGGMGVVYRAKHRILGKEVALKELASNLAASEKVQVRFQQEAYVQSELEHPNIVRVTDFIAERGQLAMIMDLIRGPSLEEALASERPGAWTIEQSMSVMKPVLDAVAYAHARGVVHRDLKPSNILLDRRDDPAAWPGVAKVADFGLAKIMASEAGMTRTGAKMGSVPYMAPEQFEGNKGIDARTDVFALGMMFWRLLSGRLPVDPEDMRAVFALYVGGRGVPSLKEIAPNVPDPVAALVMSALSADPSERPKGAAELASTLAETGDLTSTQVELDAATRESSAVQQQRSRGVRDAPAGTDPRSSPQASPTSTAIGTSESGAPKDASPDASQAEDSLDMSFQQTRALWIATGLAASFAIVLAVALASGHSDPDPLPFHQSEITRTLIEGAPAEQPSWRPGEGTGEGRSSTHTEQPPPPLNEGTGEGRRSGPDAVSCDGNTLCPVSAACDNDSQCGSGECTSGRCAGSEPQILVPADRDRSVARGFPAISQTGTLVAYRSWGSIVIETLAGDRVESFRWKPGENIDCSHGNDDECPRRREYVQAAERAQRRLREIGLVSLVEAQRGRTRNQLVAEGFLVENERGSNGLTITIREERSGEALAQDFLPTRPPDDCIDDYTPTLRRAHVSAHFGIIYLTVSTPECSDGQDYFETRAYRVDRPI